MKKKTYHFFTYFKFIYREKLVFEAISFDNNDFSEFGVFHIWVVPKCGNRTQS